VDRKRTSFIFFGLIVGLMCPERRLQIPASSTSCETRREASQPQTFALNLQVVPGIERAEGDRAELHCEITPGF
jgi:hypothetical protein